jgi:hypothetical protein
MRLFLASALTGLLLTAPLLTGCSGDPSVEQQIIATLRAMEEAAEAGEHFKFMGHVSDGFKGQQGSMDQREFHRFMIFQINQHRRLQAQFFPIHVRETGADQASANFNLLVTGGGNLLPESGQVFAVQTRWQWEGGDWLLEYADWEPVNLPDIPVNTTN